jgi:NADH:ubiquinone oxidoreductase subunit 5 (subunit L)/multisubunit Na+/H+ antiporter MnhA subunit
MKAILFLAIFTPLIGAVIIYLISHVQERFINITSTIACAVTFFSTLYLYPYVVQGHVIELKWPIGSISAMFSFRADALGLFMAMVSSLIWAISSWYAIEYFSQDRNKTRYQFFSLLSLVSWVLS